MANIDFKAADATTKYQKATGAGTNLDPFIVEHLETNSAALKTALEIIDNFISGARGLVTEDNSAAIKTAVEIIDNIVAGTEAQVDVITSALPTGAATAANQSTANTSLAAIQTAIEILDNIVSGTEAQVDVLTLPNVTLAAGTNTNEVVGDVAHDAAAAGNPVLIAGAAQTMDDSAPPNRVSTESDAARLATDLDGSLFAHPHGPQIWNYHENSSSALTDASVHAAPGAGLSLYVTDIIVSTGAATALNIFFEESTTIVLGPYYLEAVAGRGLSIHFTTPKKITANTALTVTTSAAIAHSIDVHGYIAPS